MKNTILEFVGSEKELELEAFRMALGGEANSWLEAQDLGKKDLDRIVEGHSPGDGGGATSGDPWVRQQAQYWPGICPRDWDGWVSLRLR